MNSGERDPFATWQSLMREWDAAHAHYLAAVEAKRQVEVLNGPTEELAAIAENAMADLEVIKARIGDLVAATGKARGPIGDSIIVGSIRRAGEEPAQAERPVAKALGKLRRP
ncbi:MAG: hypothetical protein HY245_07655 [Rhizobiales bacterium]|nr:hypothetical protein [Hyphomicrobiales bacterium]MBI3673280.1 hypothetical protein [Hyphomicrobiales bacterium]